MMADVDLKLLYRELVSLEIELWDGIERRLRAEYDLPLTSFEVLHLLQQQPGRRIQDIAEEFSITVGGTSKVVDRRSRRACVRAGPIRTTAVPRSSS